MIKDVIFHQNRDSHSTNGLKALHQFPGKIASFSLYEKHNKLGWGHGIVLYEGKKPTGKEIHKYVLKNLQTLLDNKHITGHSFLDEQYSYIRFVKQL